MLNSSIGMQILNGLFAMHGVIDTKIQFNGDLYLGLLTKLPNDNCEPYEDGTYFSEPSEQSYLRINIGTNSRITKEKFIGPADNDIIDGEIGPVCVKNQSQIMFPEFMQECDIVGFGIFRSKNVDSTTLPILWGEVINDQGTSGVKIKPEEVPIIRAGGFKVSLK